MNSLTMLTMAVLVIASLAKHIKFVHSQYEICHWDCELIGCDYYGDCDYDCYEVCEYWRNELHPPTGENKQFNFEGKKSDIMLRLKAQNATGSVESTRRMALWDKCILKSDNQSIGKSESDSMAFKEERQSESLGLKGKLTSSFSQQRLRRGNKQQMN